MNCHRMILCGAVLSICTQTARSQFTQLDQFNPTDLGGIVSLAFDASTQTIWAYDDFGTEFRSYSTAGVFLASVPRPGGSANDADLDIAAEAFLMNGVNVPAGSLLYFDGESGEAEVYAVDPSTGSVVASLNTSFGDSHVVGGAYHPGRDTFFLVQDRVPSGTVNDSIVAEIDPADGSVLNSFKIDDIVPDFTVNYGDIDIDPILGQLYIVSSDESRVANFTPDGGFLRTIDLPGTAGGLSGIGIADDNSGTAWVSSSSGLITLLGGGLLPVLVGDLDGDGFVGISDLNIVLGNWNLPVPPHELLSGDPSGDGFVGIEDLNLVLGNWNAGTPPIANNVPEAVTVALLLPGGVLLGRRPHKPA